MTKLAHIADRVLNRPLMILPEKLSLIASILDGRIGIDATELRASEISLAEADAIMRTGPDASRFVGNYELNDPANPAAGKKPYRTTSDGVAVIGVVGSLVNRGGWIGAYSGMTSYEGLKFQIGAAARDTSVSSILLDMDSPGGEAVGAFEAGDAVRAAAQIKEVIAVVNGMAASAAYAIAAQASRIVTTQSGISGSIGVVMLHADYSNKLHQAGIVPTMIFAGARKVDGNPYEKLTAEVKGELSAEINRFYDLFVSGVAVGRSGMTDQSIRATEARTYIGADAVAVGLADAVGSFESVLSDLSGRAPKPQKMKSKGFSMNDEANVTRAQLDTAVALARSEATAAANADRETVIGAARTEAATAERERIRAITSLPEAAGREALAMTLATTTPLSVDQVKASLSAAPKGVDSGRAGASAIGLSVNPKTEEGNSAEASGLWDKALTSRGLKLA